MSIFDRFRRKTNSASIAKERLQIIISHERTQQKDPDYVVKLQKEILAVLAKYVAIDPNQVKVQIERDGENTVLELNVTMPDRLLETA